MARALGSLGDRPHQFCERSTALSGRTFLGDKGYVKATLTAQLQKQGV